MGTSVNHTKEESGMNVMRTPGGRLRRRAAIGVVGLAALGGGGAAVAASQSGSSPVAQNQAIAADAAGQLGVSATALTAAIKTAMVDQIEAQVTAGTLRKAQATALEARLARADAPLFAMGGEADGRGGFGHARGGPGGGPVSLDAAATYIGVSAADLRAQLAAGKTLAAIATAHGKTADGLKAALAAAAKTELDGAVTASNLTQAQEDRILAALPARLDNEINEADTGGPGGSGPGGPPPADSSTAPAAA
jgi:hypothetical protein